VTGFLYSRVIDIHRADPVAVSGAANVATLEAPYSGVTSTSETVLYTGVAASIQYKDRDLRLTAPLPADTTRPGGWNIYIPNSAGIPASGITENDIVIDELGRRYQVEAAYPNPLGWKLHARFLKA
jgi:hypothetical protein